LPIIKYLRSCCFKGFISISDLLSAQFLPINPPNKTILSLLIHFVSEEANDSFARFPSPKLMNVESQASHTFYHCLLLHPMNILDSYMRQYLIVAYTLADGYLS